MSDDAPDEFTAAMRLDGAARIDALGAVGRKQVDRAIGYYERGVVRKKRFAKFLRAAALILGVMASLVPLVISLVFNVWMPESNKAKDWITLSAIFAILALGMVAIDRLFGWSSSWIRFITASIDLQSRRSKFLVTWSKIGVKQEGVTDEGHLLAVLQYLETFIADIDEIVRSETQVWVTEFRGALNELDKRIEAQRAEHTNTVVGERGALEVKVSNLVDLDERKVWVHVDGKGRIEREGTATIVVPGLPPGIVRVALSGKIKNQPVLIERACVIEAGKIVHLETAIT